MRSEMNEQGSKAGRRSPGLVISTFLDRHPAWVLGSLVIVTALPAWPMLLWGPTETASQTPRTEITAAQELVSERFADDVFRQVLLVEAHGGDMLDKEPLLELMTSSETMRVDAEVGPLLVELQDPTLGIDVPGIWTLADSVDRLLRQVGGGEGLSRATEEQVDDAVAALLGEGDPLSWGLATRVEPDAEGVWHSSALFVSVAADNGRLGGGGSW